jgi:hypothetical protein
VALVRVLTLAIVSDGRLDADEVAALDRLEAYRRIGLERGAFYREVERSCQALIDGGLSPSASALRLDDGLPRQWVDAVRAPALRHLVLQLAFEVIRSDRRLHPAESGVFWGLLDAWGLRLDEVREARWAAALAAAAMGQAAPPPARRPPRVHRLPSALVVA